MASPRGPVAIRVTRPYASVDAWLDDEKETVLRTGILLVGAQPRPEGVVLRFEIALDDGPAMRGEGRVVGFKADAFRGEPGLSLRFTRLDAASKAVVDRAIALRSSLNPPPSSHSSLLGASLPSDAGPAAPQAREDAPTIAEAIPAVFDPMPFAAGTVPPEGSMTEPSPPAHDGEAVDDAHLDAFFDRVEMPVQPPMPVIASAPPMTLPSAAAFSQSSVETGERPQKPLEAPPDRDDLLSRLRRRAAELTPERAAQASTRRS